MKKQTLCEISTQNECEKASRHTSCFASQYQIFAQKHDKKASKNPLKTSKNRVFFACFLALFLLFSTAFSLCACSKQDVQSTLANECVRIHIRANSNTENDQAVKLKVRDAITAYLQTKLDGCKSKHDALCVLEDEKQNLVEIANSTLYANNFSYKTSIAIQNEHFPDKQYGDYTFPEGNYDALIIYLGEGVGDNWWCVAFPPLCFVPAGESGEKIVYKSWVKELLDKIFS